MVTSDVGKSSSGCVAVQGVWGEGAGFLKEVAQRVLMSIVERMVEK